MADVCVRTAFCHSGTEGRRWTGKRWLCGGCRMSGRATRHAGACTCMELHAASMHVAHAAAAACVEHDPTRLACIHGLRPRSCAALRPSTTRRPAASPPPCPPGGVTRAERMADCCWHLLGLQADGAHMQTRIQAGSVSQGCTMYPPALCRALLGPCPDLKLVPA
jgi:hypothetical protein